MGAWGTGLFSDDVACEVKEYYTNCLREEMTAEQAEMAVAEYFSDELATDDDGPVVILALADTAWRMGRLSDKLKNAAIGIIDNGEDLKHWRDEGASLLKKRQAVLMKLKEKLLSPQPPLKKVYKHRWYKCPWQIGDAFALLINSDFAKSDFAKEYNLYGKYLIIQKADEILERISDKIEEGDICPIVRVWFSDKPVFSNDPNSVEFIKSTSKPIKKGKYNYCRSIITTSSRIIPKELIYLGNYKLIMSDDDGGIDYGEYSHPSVLWKWFEDSMIKSYLVYNLDKYDFSDFLK